MKRSSVASGRTGRLGCSCILCVFALSLTAPNNLSHKPWRKTAPPLRNSLQIFYFSISLFGSMWSEMFSPDFPFPSSDSFFCCFSFWATCLESCYFWQKVKRILKEWIWHTICYCCCFCGSYIANWTWLQMTTKWTRESVGASSGFYHRQSYQVSKLLFCSFPADVCPFLAEENVSWNWNWSSTVWYFISLQRATPSIREHFHRKGSFFPTLQWHAIRVDNS